MKLFSGLITILFALLISATAAWFSVAGLVALFAATAIPVMIMGVVLESSKLVAAGWLHTNWKNPKVNFIHKTYLTIAVIALMMITSIGIYGFLSKGHLEQAAPVAGIELQINAKQQQIQMLQDSNTRLMEEQKQLDAGVNAFLQGGSLKGATAGLKARGRQTSERASIQKQMDANNTQIQQLNADILPLKQQTAEVEAKLGPVKYVAQLFGWKDTDSAVRLVIGVIMIAFDPLAVILLISGTISLGEWSEERAQRNSRKEDEVDDTNVISGRFAYPNGIAPQVEDDIRVVPKSEAIILPTEEELNAQKEIRAGLEEMNNMLVSVDSPVVEKTATITEPTTEQVETQTDEDKLDVMRAADPIAPETVATAITAEPVVTTTPVAEKAPNDKERLIEILEKRPEILQDLIDVISSHRQQEEAKAQAEVVATPKVDVDAPKPWLG